MSHCCLKSSGDFSLHSKAKIFSKACKADMITPCWCAPPSCSELAFPLFTLLELQEPPYYSSHVLSIPQLFLCLQRFPPSYISMAHSITCSKITSKEKLFPNSNDHPHPAQSTVCHGIPYLSSLVYFFLQYLFSSDII